MTRSRTLRRGAAVAGAAFLLVAGAITPAQAALPRGDRGTGCFDPASIGAGSAAKGGRGTDHRHVSSQEAKAIQATTRDRLAARGVAPAKPNQAGKPLLAVTVPVYVHVMAAADGTGDVTDQQISDQIAVLNTTYAGDESPAAADLGITFTLAGTDRYYNDTWHNDKNSNQYRKLTRQGGANALNIWLVEFNYLGIATFPWDYRNQGAIDGIRVLWSSLPGGTERNYNLGETATHEAGHWFGLFHVFEGGCKEPSGGDQVADTPAQSTATNGCPEGQDSCAGGGLDSIHNYMDYSYDSCYDQFTPGQAARAADMWNAYRA
ncbi:zinc metalloprotease [Nocardioides iriomotensis]|uniref:Zinc metalloprotease n=1 Tax=Nocardioides iriomotensis TaxID=715784 RepID=A0A4Q5J489_9ACTN|nr:zinc metalloprotease [Nocardioides iriomotensis]RYU12399.1 zinc metalloprotease [Nocardioides iriomotensis]